MGSDVRVCFVGDSFVAGYGDPEHRGWAGRAAAGAAVTVYNVGIRHDTSADVLGADDHDREGLRRERRLFPGGP